jgi:hypothetical protein
VFRIPHPFARAKAQRMESASPAGFDAGCRILHDDTLGRLEI